MNLFLVAGQMIDSINLVSVDMLLILWLSVVSKSIDLLKQRTKKSSIILYFLGCTTNSTVHKKCGPVYFWQFY